jgi:hypothetical protein
MAALSPPPDEVEISVVIPCLNEEKTITLCVEKALRSMREANIAGEVVVSDNGSTDRSVEVAAAAGARVAHCPVRGYGAALQFGFAAARGRYVLMGDADDSYDFLEVPRFVERLRQGHPYVMGTRLKGKVMPGAMPLLNRYVGTPVLTMILNYLFGTRITDCNSGMRAFDRKAVLGLEVTSTGMEFASELIVKAAIAGMPIVEVPITLHKDKRDRAPHLRPWRDGWRHLRLLLWHAPDQTMINPGLWLLALGLLLVATQATGPIVLGGLRFDLHFMILGLTFSMLGLSAATMGVAVHAVMPDRKLRRSKYLGDVRKWFTFDRAAIASAVLLLSGLSCDGYVLAYWLATHRGDLTAEYTRLSLIGLLLIAMGFEILLAGLLVGTAQTASATPIAETITLPPSPQSEPAVAPLPTSKGKAEA